MPSTMTPSHFGHRQSGLTLVECMIALVLLSTAIMAGLEMLEFHSTVSVRNVQAVRAVTILGREMEIVRASRFDTLDTRGAFPAPRDPDFRVSRVVTPVDASTREVTVTVDWTEDGHARYRRATTYRNKEAP